MTPAPRSLRQRQARSTRDAILAAAREAFREHGYGAATIAGIAARAGVGVSTVYAVHGSKLGLLRALRSMAGSDGVARELVAEAITEPDPLTRLQMAAHATRRHWQASGDQAAIEASAAASEPEAAASWPEARDGWRRELEPLVDGLAPHLRIELDLATARAIVAALTRPELRAELVVAQGWSDERYEAWLAATLARQLFG